MQAGRGSQRNAGASKNKTSGRNKPVCVDFTPRRASHEDQRDRVRGSPVAELQRFAAAAEMMREIARHIQR